MLGIKAIPGGSLATPTAPQMTDVNPNRWGTDEPSWRKPSPFRAGRRSEYGFITILGEILNKKYIKTLRQAVVLEDGLINIVER